MNICLVQQHPLIPGKTPAAILRYLKLAEGLSRHHQVRLIAPGEGGRKGRGEFAGLPVYYVPTPGGDRKALNMLVFSLSLFPVLRQVEREFRPDIWFIDEPFVVLSFLPFRLFNRTPINYDVMGIHFYQVRKNNRKWTRHLLLAPMYWLLDRLTIGIATFLTTVNEAHKELLQRWTQKPVHVIRDAAEFLPPGVDDLPVQLPEKGADEVWLTFIGKISNNRLDDIFQVLPQLFQRLPGLRFLIVGDGPFREKYMQWAQQDVLDSRIVFHEFVPHSRLPEFMGVTDIAYSDDWSDVGFPMKVYEYMHMGMAMVVQDTPAVREELVNGENALLYDGKQQLLEQIERLATDSGLRQDLGERALSYAGAHCNWENRIEQFEELYQRYTGKQKLI